MRRWEALRAKVRRLRKSRFTEDDIAAWLADAERGRSIEDICRDARISERTFYRWREKFGCLPVNALRTLKRLEEENRILRRAMTLSGTALKAKPPARFLPFAPSATASPRISTRSSSAYSKCRSH